MHKVLINLYRNGASVYIMMDGSCITKPPKMRKLCL